MREVIFSTHPCYLSLCPGFLLCSLRQFRLLTSGWTPLPRLVDDDTRDRTASLVARLPCCHDITDSRKAMGSIVEEEKEENGFKYFNRRILASSSL